MNTVELIVDAFDDGTPGYVAVCEAMPDIIGHGDDEDEAELDWLMQYESRTLH